jgi:hypothetical protein
MQPIKKIITTDQTLALKANRTTPTNIDISFLEPWKMIAIRAARTYLQSIVVFTPLLAYGVGPVDPNTFIDALKLAAGFSLAPTVGSIVNNTLDVLAGWDTSKPEIRG